MIEAKPVAYQWTDEHGELCWTHNNGMQPINALPLFTESQLKAEVEKARINVLRECSELCNKISFDEEFGHMYADGSGKCADEINNILDNQEYEN
jgi:hypothetical protein